MQGIYNINSISALGRKMDNLNTFNTNCQVSDSFVHHSDQANIIDNFQGNNNFQRPPYNPQYNPQNNLRWKNHPNLPHKNQNHVMPPPHWFAPQEKKFDLKGLLKSYINFSETKLKNQ